MTHENAEWLLGEYFAVVDDLQRIAGEMSTRLPELEAKARREDVGRALTRLMLAVEVVVAEHPDLRPAGMIK